MQYADGAMHNFSPAANAVVGSGYGGKVVLTVDVPKEGDAQATTASLPSTSSTCIKGVQWIGDLDDFGKIQTGKSYTVYILVGIKEGQENNR